jgi:hypothetical protein
MQSSGIDVHFFAATFAASTVASSALHVAPSFFASTVDGSSREASPGGDERSIEASAWASEAPVPTVQSSEQLELIAQSAATKHRRTMLGG